MASIYIYNSTKQQRHEKALEFITKNNLAINHPDLMLVDPLEGKKSIGIDQVKEVIEFCSTKPFSAKKKLVVVPEADKLTDQAQNALLKTLEEHADNIEIILAGQSLNSVLPTILSRCKKINLHNRHDTQETAIENFSNIFSLSTGERIAFSEDIGKLESEEIVSIIKNWINILRQDISNPTFAQNTKLLLKALSDLENTNMNKKLIVEWLLISFV